MAPLTTLYEACEQLFADYPLAIEHHGSAPDSMVLATVDSGEPQFWFLGRSRGACFQAGRWDGGDDAMITPDGGPVSAAVTSALTSGFPLPRDGALLAWAPEGVATALVTFHSGDDPAPTWSVMPRMEGHDAWPPFTGERLPGPWLWEYYRSGEIRDLSEFVASSPGAVWWSRVTAGEHDLGVCTVSRDVRRDGLLLRVGRYVYYRVLRDGLSVPPAATLLGDAADLSELFAS
jgi:hypothetical protein